MIDTKLTGSEQYALQTLRAKWVGRNVHSSATAKCNHGTNLADPRPVTEVWYSDESASFFAFAGEHHQANSIEALDRQLESLAVQ